MAGRGAAGARARGEEVRRVLRAVGLGALLGWVLVWATGIHRARART